MSVKSVFTQYYRQGFWATDESSSGPNSSFDCTPQLRESLNQLLLTYGVKRILDAGCGDANLMRYLDFTGIEYMGVDCVDEMIAHNRAKHPSSMQFSVSDILTDTLPAADLMICRDVVHYLPNDLIFDLLRNVARSEIHYLLITHNTHCHASANDATDIGVFRPVNLCYPPFELDAPMAVIEEDFLAKALAMWRVSDMVADLDHRMPHWRTHQEGVS